MAFNNYIVEADLRSYIPELSRLVWSDESDYSAQGVEAVNCVKQDLTDKGYKIADLMVQLALRESGTTLSGGETGDKSGEDKISRSRFVYNISVFTAGGTKTITLEGTNDASNETWNTVTTKTITATGNNSALINNQYKYYRVVTAISAGTMDFESFMVETTFDRLIKYKWLEYIMIDRYVTENDQFFLKRLDFQKMYNDLLNTVQIPQDLDGDGAIDSGEVSKTSSIQMLK